MSLRGKLSLLAVSALVLAGAASALFRREAEPRVPQPDAPIPATARGETGTPQRAAAWVHGFPSAEEAPPAPGALPLAPGMPASLARACEEADPARRLAFITAELRAWAAADVDAAGDWAQRQSFLVRAVALAAVVNGAAAGDPAAAERYVRERSEAEPDRAVEYGGFLIFALGEAGQHARAAAWASRAPDTAAMAWLTSAYSRWAAYEPETAWLAGAALEHPQQRRTACQAALAGWAREHPRNLADCAVNFPAGPEKDLALVTALRTWAAREPEAVAGWMAARRDRLADVAGLQRIWEN